MNTFLQRYTAQHDRLLTLANILKYHLSTEKTELLRHCHACMLDICAECARIDADLYQTLQVEKRGISE